MTEFQSYMSNLAKSLKVKVMSLRLETTNGLSEVRSRLHLDYTYRGNRLTTRTIIILHVFPTVLTAILPFPQRNH